MSNVNWFEENDITKAMGLKPIVVEDLTWAELREYAKEQGVDLAKYRKRDEIEKQLKE